MLRLLTLVASIALADSLNPSTIGPGLYLASGKNPRSALTQFIAGVFAVNTVGGALIALGPGQAVLALVPHPRPTTVDILEVLAGVVMLIFGIVLWQRRQRLARHNLPSPSAGGKSSLLLGITIAGVELPTAFPYFAAIAAIVGSGQGPINQLIALGVYNVIFVLPLILMIVTITFAGDESERILGRARDWLQAHWPVLLSGLALLAGVYVTVLGVTGLTSGGHGTVARFSRTIRSKVPH
ncbi:MAG TPA: GAP family protein [Solirubrobacteraceae bacterium]|nr:GAP family protein [Solirubrobacteraceae bacterium]